MAHYYPTQVRLKLKLLEKPALREKKARCLFYGEKSQCNPNKKLYNDKPEEARIYS